MSQEKPYFDNIGSSDKRQISVDDLRVDDVDTNGRSLLDESTTSIRRSQREELPAKTKTKILIACLFALCIGNMMMLNVAAFLPSFL